MQHRRVPRPRRIRLRRQRPGRRGIQRGGNVSELIKTAAGSESYQPFRLRGLVDEDGIKLSLELGMEPSAHSGSGKSFKGPAGLVVALGVVAFLLVALPAYRWFFLISVGIGLAVAGILFLWHRLRPIEEKDVEHKR